MKLEEAQKLVGKKVQNPKYDSYSEGKIESVSEDNLYTGDTIKATIYHGGNIPRTGVVAEKLVNGEIDWELVE